MKEVRIIKKYLKDVTPYFSKEQELLFNNKQILLYSLQKTSHFSLLKHNDSPLLSFLLEKNYQITKTDLKPFLSEYKTREKLLEDVNYFFVKKLGDIIKIEEEKRMDYQKIQATLLQLELEKSTSINKYYNINRDLRPYSLFYFIKEIENKSNKSKLADVLYYSLSLKGITISDLLKEYERDAYQNIVLIKNIVKSLLSIHKSTLSFQSIYTPKKSYTRPTMPLCFHFLSNKNYTLFLNNSGEGISKYKNILLFRQDKTSFTLQDKKTNSIYSLQVYDEDSKYKNIFNEAISSYVKKYEEFTIKTEISVSQEEDLELRVFHLKNTHYESKAFTIKMSFTLPFLQNGNIKYSKMIQNTTYNYKLHSFITYDEESHLYFVAKFFPFDKLSINVDRNQNTVSFSFSLKANEEKRFYFLGFVAPSKNSIYSILQKYQNISKNYEYLFFRANSLKNNSSYRDFMLYHTFFNLFFQADLKKDKEREKKLLLYKPTIHNLWKYQISGDYKVLLIHIKEKYNFKTIDEIFSFHNYLKNNGINIDLLFIYSNEKTKEEILELKKYYSLLNHDTTTSLGIFLLSSLELDCLELEHLRILSTLSIEINDKHSFQDIVALLKRKQSRQKVLQSFEKFLEQEKKIKEELVSFSDIFEEEEHFLMKKTTSIKTKSSPSLYSTFSDSFGNFDIENNEYVLCNPVYPFSILLSNSYLYSISSSFLQNSLCSTDSIIFKESNFHEFLLDNQPIFFHTIRLGFGYFVFEYQDSIKDFVLTKFLSTIDPIQFNKFDIYNKSEQTITIQLKFLLLPILGFHESECRYITSLYDKENNLIKIKNRLTGQQLFISATKNFKNVFLDSFLEKVVEIEIVLEKKEKKSFAILVGTNPRKDYFLENSDEIYNKNILLLKEKYANISVVDNSLHLTTVHFRDLIHILTIETDDIDLNLMCKWMLYEVLLFNGYDRENLLQQVFLYTTENLLYDGLSLISILPDISKKNILKCMEHTTYKGEILSSFNASKNVGVLSSTLSLYLLLFYSIQKYLEVSEDYSILDEEVSYLITSKNIQKKIYFKSTKYNESFYQHLEKIINFILEKEISDSKVILYQILCYFVSITKIYDKNKDIKFYRERLHSLEREIKTEECTVEDTIYKVLLSIPIDKNEEILTKIKSFNPKLLRICALAKVGKVDEAFHLYKKLNSIHQISTSKTKNKIETHFSLQNSFYYILFLELFLGIKRQGKKIFVTPTLPSCMNEFRFSYKYYSTIYDIHVFKDKVRESIVIDGEEAIYISLKNDYKKHIVEVYYKEKNCS